MDFTNTRQFTVVDNDGNSPSGNLKLPLWVFCKYRGQLMDGPFTTVEQAEEAAQRLKDFPLPLHNDNLDDLPEGLYLTIWHGRSTVDQKLEDWGYDGPVIGPLEYVHTTYASHIKMSFINDEDFRKYQEAGVFREDSSPDFAELAVDVRDGLLKCKGKFYGDWSIFYLKH